MIEKFALVRIAFCNAPAFTSACCGDTSGWGSAAAVGEATARSLRVVDMAESVKPSGCDAMARRSPQITTAAAGTLFAGEHTVRAFRQTLTAKRSRAWECPATELLNARSAARHRKASVG